MNKTARVALVLALVLTVLVVMHGQIQWTQQQTSPDAKLQSSIPDNTSYCAHEDGQCTCSGTVIYGAINGHTINTLHPVWKRDGFTSLKQMLAAPHLTKQVDGQIQCTQDSFTGSEEDSVLSRIKDPEFGEAKYCRCITADIHRYLQSTYTRYDNGIFRARVQVL